MKTSYTAVTSFGKNVPLGLLGFPRGVTSNLGHTHGQDFETASIMLHVTVPLSKRTQLDLSYAPFFKISTWKSRTKH